MSLNKLLRKKHKFSLFTTPSHSQNFAIVSKFSQFYKYDISEIDIYNPQKALDSAQKKASEIYGVKKTLFLTNGSSSGVIAAVLACVQKNDNVLIWEKAHICHKNAIELAGATPVFYNTEFDENWGIYKPIEPSQLEEILSENKIKAIIITSPTYEGIPSKINEIMNICKKYNCYLIVDEAHGALYPFSEELPVSAVQIADFTIQSLHKTAGGLNPTALLHCNCDCKVEEALAKINTTSPSYPLLMSIEANINYLNSQKGRKKINELIQNIKKLKNNCPNIDFFDGDITKILIKTVKFSGEELSKKLYENNIEDERSNSNSVMLLCGLGIDDKKLKRLEKVLKHIL